MRIWRGGLGKGALALSLVAFVGVAQAGSPIPVTDCGQVLDVAGAEYVLSPSLDSCGGAKSLTIAASGIHLNTAGLTVYSILDVVNINDDLSDILIDGGGSLVGGGGLTIGKDRHVIVKGVTLQGESDLGGSTAGVLIDGATDVSIRGCQISGSLSTAVQMNDASNIMVNEDFIYGSLGVSGIADDVEVRNNNIIISSEGNGAGVAVTGRSNRVQNNAFLLASFNPGLSLSDTAIIVADHENVRNNVISQFYFGIELIGDFSSVVENVMNVSPAMGRTGIAANSGAVHNRIWRNVVGSGYETDLSDSNGPPCVNVWRNNNFGTGGGATACIH